MAEHNSRQISLAAFVSCLQAERRTNYSHKWSRYVSSNCLRHRRVTLSRSAYEQGFWPSIDGAGHVPPVAHGAWVCMPRSDELTPKASSMAILLIHLILPSTSTKNRNLFCSIRPALAVAQARNANRNAMIKLGVTDSTYA